MTTESMLAVINSFVACHLKEEEKEEIYLSPYCFGFSEGELKMPEWMHAVFVILFR